MRRPFTKLAFDSDSLGFGSAQFPVSRRGVTIGAGHVIPEIKFTLPPMDVHEGTMNEVRGVYKDIIEGVCKRAVELHQNEMIVEFELLPEMTVNPAWGEEITFLLCRALNDYRMREGLQSLVRVTPVDIREPRKRREGSELELLLDSFRRCAVAGGDMLSIESTGGKEVTDPSIMAADVRGILFGTVILGCSDMEFLWEHICGIAGETSTIAAGDTACGIGNTAMVLADQGYVPKVFSAVVRAVTAVRSLVAYEVGAVGPGKDCGYENAILKAVTGYPMSLEGRSAACAHFSAVGNIAASYADLWSNESVQHIKLLSGMAPVVSMEQLIYDCRLFNTASRNGTAGNLRDTLVESDASLDPQAYILKPDVVVALAECTIGEDDDYQRGLCCARTAVEIMRHGVSRKELVVSNRELMWLEKMESEINQLPASSGQFIAEEMKRWKDTCDYSQYAFETVRT